MSQLFESTVRSNVLQVRSDELNWLSTGANGGSWRATAAYNITVPEGWDETDLEAYTQKRRVEAGFEQPGPALLTGVDQRHAHRARLDPVEVVVTAGVSNPTTLPPSNQPRRRQSRLTIAISRAPLTSLPAPNNLSRLARSPT